MGKETQWRGIPVIAKAIRKRLEREGEWSNFNARVSEVAKAKGYEQLSEAFAEVLQEFKPKKGKEAYRGGTLAEFAERECTDRESIRWALHHVDAEGLEPSGAPSIFAWSLIVRMKADAGLYADILKSALPRLLPTSAELDRDERRRSGGRVIANTLKELIAMSRRAQASSTS